MTLCKLLGNDGVNRMSLEATPLEAMQDSLRRAIHGWRNTAILLPVPSERLRSFSHEVSLTKPDRLPHEDSAEPLATGLQVSVAELTARHYLLALIDTPYMNDGTFPKVMTQAACLRSYLSTAEQLELFVLLVAPLGSAEDTAWHQAARRLEGNEAIARVLVWLVPQSKIEWSQSLERFMGRLFLGSLPQVREAAADLAPTAAVFTGTSLPEEVLEVWRTTLLEPDLQAKERALRLLNALDGQIEA